MGESETLRDEDRDSETKTCIETGGQEEERPKDSPRKIWNVTGSQKEPEKERERNSGPADETATERFPKMKRGNRAFNNPANDHHSRDSSLAGTLGEGGSLGSLRLSPPGLRLCTKDSYLSSGCC